MTIKWIIEVLSYKLIKHTFDLFNGFAMKKKENFIEIINNGNIQALNKIIMYCFFWSVCFFSYSDSHKYVDKLINDINSSREQNYLN